VFLAIAVDNLADADALGENEAKDDAAEADADDVVYEVRAIGTRFHRPSDTCRSDGTNWQHFQLIRLEITL